MRSAALLDKSADLSILDLGAGNSRHTLPIAKLTSDNSTVTAIDRLPIAVAQINQKASTEGVGEKVCAFLGDVEQVDYGQQRFDLVIPDHSLIFIFPCTQEYGRILTNRWIGRTMKLGAKLRRHRERRQWTQPEAADAIGIEQSYLSKLENDHSVPSLDVFRKIADAYQTNVGEMMDGIDASEYAHLAQITDVADYLNAEKQERRLRQQRRTTHQVVAVALGACLIYAGVANLFFPSVEGAGEAWRNQAVTFVGIFALTYGLIGLLVASAQQQNRNL